MDKRVKLGIIGLGARAETLLATISCIPEEIKVTAICDIQQERIDKLSGCCLKYGMDKPLEFTDYHKLLSSDEVQAVLIPTSWNSHFKIAAAALNAGKYAGIEVGGASSIDELWQLVHGCEATGVSCMMLENCCYGRNELMVLNLVRQGLFGEIIHCTCGYEHYLADRLSLAQEERSQHNIARCGDLYPTHGLGPIAKILNINHGNRFLTISSFASKARGFAEAAKANGLNTVFNEGDVITSVIRCANGETITMTHGVSLPRPYSRDCRVQGTKGIWLEDANGIYVDGLSKVETIIDIAGNPYDKHIWDKVEDYYEQYDHPLWKSFRDNQVGGHGGLDALTLSAFADSVRRNAPTPIDVYDCAAWMAATCLSEQSIASGGMPMPFPDFTNGNWIYPAPKSNSKWSLN